MSVDAFDSVAGSADGAGAAEWGDSAADAWVGTARVVDAFEAGRRARAAAEAAEIQLMAAAAQAVARPAGASPEQARRAELDRRALIADLATSTRVSEWMVTRLLTEASDLVHRFPAAVGALHAGVISRQHLSVIHDLGSPIQDDQARAEFTRIAIDRARGLTPGRLTPVLKVIAERFMECSLAQRHADAVATRDVRIIDLADGLATLSLTHDAALIHGIHDRLTAQARLNVDARRPSAPDDTADNGSTDVHADGCAEGTREDDANAACSCADAAAAREPHDTRTMDQLRADIATDILLTAGPNECVAGTGLDAIHATVQVTVPVLTMTGHSTDPALLAGYGPIDPDTARHLAATAPAWARVMTDPVTGRVLAVDRYRPHTSLTRFLAARDEHCRFPGCRRLACRCDIDHTIDAAHGGPTDHRNLAHLCRRHHTLKHHTAWTVQQSSPGVLTWTSPTGRRHTDRPESTVRFQPDPQLLTRRQVLHEPWLFEVDDRTAGRAAPF